VETPSIKIATWNVNSIKARLPHLLAWLREHTPDAVLLQETKVADEAFPSLEIGDLGYNIAAVGQKAYNGVAVLSKGPIEILARALPGRADDAQARYLEVFTGGLRLVSLYAPNGNPASTAKFDFKLDWLDRLYQHTRELLASEDPFVLGGDFNVVPEDIDVYDPVGWKGDALCRPESRAGFRKILHLGLTDAIRALSSEPHRFTWWDYRAGAFAADHGLRIDHLLLSPQGADRLLAADVDRTPRAWDRASDHAPVWCELQAA
jgi:exodeoxyribonuclease-3